MIFRSDVCCDFRCAAEGDGRYSQRHGEAKGDDQVNQSDPDRPVRSPSTRPEDRDPNRTGGVVSMIDVHGTCFVLPSPSFMMNHLRMSLRLVRLEQEERKAGRGRKQERYLP